MSKKRKRLSCVPEINEVIEATDLDNGFWAQLLDRRAVVLSGEINEETFEKVVLPLMYLDDGSEEPIEMYINCDGGDLNTAWAICDAIDSIKTPLHKYILGAAASGGAMVALAGKGNPKVHTTCGPHTTFLIHNGSCNCGGELGTFISFARWSEVQTNQMWEYIAKHSKLTPDAIERIRGTEHYFTAEEALEYGFVDEVV